MWLRLLILGLGLVVGAAVILTIAVTVNEFITQYNLPRLIRDALGNSTEEKAKKLLAQALNGKIHELDGNTISVSLFSQNGTEEAQVKITGSGISNSLSTGMTI